MTCSSFVLKVSKGGLLLLLLGTVVLNIMFVLETNRRLNQDIQVNNNVIESNNRNDQREDERPEPRIIQVEVVSSKEQVLVKVNKEMVLVSEGGEEDRGIHILVLHQATGSVMARRRFDTYQGGEDLAMVDFLNNTSPGRVLIFTVKDEASFSLKDDSRKYLSSLDSLSAGDLKWRDMWAFITVKGYGAVAEKLNKSPDLGSWGDKLTLSATIPFTSHSDSQCKRWPATEETRRRRQFCDQYEGYGSVCSCSDPTPIHFTPQQLQQGGILDVPVSVIASNRPQYLYKMLSKMLQIRGVPKDKVTVFIDGYFDEPLAVVKLLGLRGIQHSPVGVKNARISQHYKASITATFNFFPTKEYIILIEEDLELAPDFFGYFQQTKHLLDTDDSLYCVSAWNDQGYDHSCQDPSLLYRIETMPGLGWMMKKSLYKDELEPQWPSQEKQWDWDMWMRHPPVRKDRECIIPDVSRTFHFGSKGLNINPFFQELYFQNHTLQSIPHVKLKDVDKMKKEPYEELVKDLIKSAKVLDHSKNPCANDFIPESKSADTYVLYIKMDDSSDFVTWKQLAKCYHLWDLDVRGFHKSMWRQFHKGKHLVIVGVPASPYATFKPSEVTPVYIPEPKKDR